MLESQIHRGRDAQSSTAPCYLWGAAVRLGARRRPAESLDGLDAFFAANGLPADPSLLGMGHFHEADDAAELALAAAQDSLAAAAEDVDAVILCASRFRGETGDHAAAMHRLLTGLGLAPDFTAGVTMNRCASFLAGLRLAEAMVRAGQVRTCLAITADRFATDAERLRPFALFPTAPRPASSAPRRRQAPATAWPAARPPLIQRPLPRRRASRARWSSRANTALARISGHAIAEHARVLPTNVFTPIVMIAEAQGGATSGTLYLDNIVRRGHVFAADPLVNLVDLEASGAVVPGSRLWLAATVPGLRVALSLERL
jgi:3-oxoacyl-[acyl-carrier-protein] synthase III